MQRLGVTPATTTLSLTTADTEYSYTVPDGTKRLIFKLRTLDGDVTYGWATGARNMTISAGFVRDISDINFVARTLFVSCNLADKILEIETYQ